MLAIWLIFDYQHETHMLLVDKYIYPPKDNKVYYSPPKDNNIENDIQYYFFLFIYYLFIIIDNHPT